MNEETRSYMVSVFEFLNVIKRYRSLLLALPLVAAALAILLILFFIRPAWEGSVILEIGHIGQTGQTGPMPIEPALNVVSRMLHPSFAEGALSYAAVKPEELKEARAFLEGTLKVAQVKGTTELVEVKLGGDSPEMARNLIQGSVAKLQNVHSEMMVVSIDRYKKQIQILAQDILDTKSDIELLRKKLLADHNWNAFDANLSANLLQSKSSELRDMIQRKMQLEEQISPSRTYTTRVVGGIYVPEKPRSQHKVLIVGFAMLLGLIVAGAIAFAHNAIKSVPRAGS